MIANSSSVSLSGLLRISVGVFTLPMSCMSAARPNLAQQRAVDAEAARLRHRENRHVHHVREGVVVVLLQRRQRHQRRAVVHDRLREAVDHRLRRGRVGLRVRARAFPHHAGDRHGVGVHAADRRRVGLFLGHPLFERDAADADVRRFELRRRFLQRVSAERLLELAELARKGLELVERDVALDRDALDAHRAEPANQLAHRRAGLGHRQIADDQLVAEDADDDRRVVRVERAERFGEPLEVARDDRMAGRVQLDAAQRRAEAPEQIVRRAGSVVVAASSTSVACCGPIAPRRSRPS